MFQRTGEVVIRIVARVREVKNGLRIKATITPSAIVFNQ